MSPEFEAKPKPRIVETTLYDIPAYRGFHAKSWLDTYPNEEVGVERQWVADRVATWTTPEAIAKSREFVAPILASDAHFHRLAKAGDEVVGLAHASNENSHQHIEAIYIDKDYQGTGLAQEMMGQMLDWLDCSKDVTLEVVSYNDRAIRFYNKYGFEIVPDSDHLFLDKIPTVNMIRKGLKDEI